MTRNVFAALAVALLLVTSGCLGALGAGAQTEDSPENESHGHDITIVQENDEPRTVSVGSTGEASAEPDRAVLQVAVTATGDDPEAVRQTLADDAAQLREALSEYGLSEENVTTRRYHVRESRESHRSEEVTEYRGIHSFEITLDDTEAVGDVVEVSLQNGADDVNRISFTLSPEREAELREEALADAMENARADADVVAANVDAEIVGVRAASTHDSRVRPYHTEYAAAAGDSASETNIDSGPVTVTARVNVVYEIEENE